jgi:pimeloyl-ACP methyl ester carboxylesterase
MVSNSKPSLLLLAPSHPAVAAIIADSPYASTGDVVQNIINYRFAEETASWKPFFRWTRTVFPIISWTVVRVCNLLFRLRFGHPFIAHPVKSFNRLKKLAKAAQQPRHIPILLIHASGDQLIPIAHAHRIVAAAERNGIHVDTYFVEHPAHCGAYGYDPERYTAKLRAFVAKHVQRRFSSAED